MNLVEREICVAYLGENTSRGCTLVHELAHARHDVLGDIITAPWWDTFRTDYSGKMITQEKLRTHVASWEALVGAYEHDSSVDSSNVENEDIAAIAQDTKSAEEKPSGIIYGSVKVMGVTTVPVLYGSSEVFTDQHFINSCGEDYDPILQGNIVSFPLKRYQKAVKRKLTRIPSRSMLEDIDLIRFDPGISDRGYFWADKEYSTIFNYVAEDIADHTMRFHALMLNPLRNADLLEQLTKNNPLLQRLEMLIEHGFLDESYFAKLEMKAARKKKLKWFLSKGNLERHFKRK